MSLLSKIPASFKLALDVARGPKPAALTEDQLVKAEAALGRLDALATALDDGLRVPILGLRVGVDPLLGALSRRAAATIGGGMSLYVLVEAVRMGAPPALLIRIIGRSALDLLLQLVPLVGGALDAAYHSYRGNVQDLKRWLEGAVALRPISVPGTYQAAPAMA
ncbi:MAG: DUF4112 domain-containing protein [Myxococcales bacterium]|nr:DUF4112 domain-containing protein [Myxococcales bacterium]MCB9735538.1 DUF4112 domain-containing protein [Deltaproteobacteria bacterium]